MPRSPSLFHRAAKEVNVMRKYAKPTVSTGVGSIRQ
jgi:hypothetical protein